jgi:hypothetical protein
MTVMVEARPMAPIEFPIDRSMEQFTLLFFPRYHIILLLFAGLLVAIIIVI